MKKTFLISLSKEIDPLFPLKAIGRSFKKGTWLLQSRSVESLAIFLVGLTIWLYPAFSLAQSNIKVEGYVVDQDDAHPIPQATVKINNTNYQSRTNSLGYFFFEKIPVGEYSLSISSPSYERKVISSVKVSEELTVEIFVQLKRKIYFLPGLEVTAEKKSIQTKSIQTIEKTQIERMGAKTVSEVIDNLCGIFIQKSGTVAGAHRVSIRGSAPKHVLILVDGQRINPSGSGIADLNTISLEMVEKIEILKGGQSAIYGPDALAGVINLITFPQRGKEPSRLSLRNFWGKWDTDIFNSCFSDNLFEKLFIKLAYSHQYAKNDFKIWVYGPRERELYNQQGKNGDSTTTRKNAHKKAFNWFLALSYPLGSATELNLSGHIYQAMNGIPGSYGWMVAYQRAWAKDQRKLLNLKLAHRFSPTIFWENHLGWSRFEQRFKNDTIFVFDTRYVDDLYEFSSLIHIRTFPTNQLKIGTQFDSDVLNHTDLLHPEKSMGQIRRETYSAFLSDEQRLILPHLLFFDKLNLNLALRWDNFSALKDFISPQVGLALLRGERYRIALRANYGKSYRQPSNNALFWKEDVFAEGNPNLLPEKSEHSEVGGEVHLPWMGKLLGGITYFHSVVKDLIEWHRRFDGRYHPVNISRAKIYGHEDFVSWKGLKDLLEVDYNNTVCYAKNKSGDRLYDGKFIPFRPRYRTNLSIKVNHKGFELSYKLRWVSERFTGPANTISQLEAPYHLQDLRIGFKTKIWGVQTHLGCEWRNLTDEEYELIDRHPMPGRSWGLSLHLIRDFDR